MFYFIKNITYNINNINETNVIINIMTIYTQNSYRIYWYNILFFKSIQETMINLVANNSQSG